MVEVRQPLTAVRGDSSGKLDCQKRERIGRKRENVTYSSDSKRGGKDARENEKRTKRRQDGQMGGRHERAERRLNANYKYTIDRD